MTYIGWHQVAFERETSTQWTGISVGDRRIVLLRAGREIRVFDAYCPHRGADLCAGSLIGDQAVMCPFHGRRIGLGKPADDGFFARELPTLVVGGLVFVLFDSAQERGLANCLTSLDRTHCFFPGFSVEISTRPEMVIENAFDHRHFKHVHGLETDPALTLVRAETGHLVVSGQFWTGRPPAWQMAGTEGDLSGLGFLARVFSPNVCVTELHIDGDRHVVVTTATPERAGACRVRVSVALELAADGSLPNEARARRLLRDSRASIEQDRRIWEGLSPRPINNLVAEDALIARYQRFCSEFSENRDE